MDAFHCSLRTTPKQGEDFEDSDIDFDSLMSVKYSFGFERLLQVPDIFQSSPLPSLMKTFTQVYEKAFPVPSHPAPFKLTNSLWEKFRKAEGSSKDQMHRQLSNVLASRLSEQETKTQKDAKAFLVKEEKKDGEEAPEKGGTSKLKPGQEPKGKPRGPKCVRDAQEVAKEKVAKEKVAKQKAAEDLTKVILGSSAGGKTTMAFTFLSGENLQNQVVDLTNIVTNPQYQPHMRVDAIDTSHGTGEKVTMGKSGEKVTVEKSGVTTTINIAIPASSKGGSEPFSPVRPLDEIGEDGVPIVPEEGPSDPQAGSSSVPDKSFLDVPDPEKKQEKMDEEGDAGMDGDDEDEDDHEDNVVKGKDQATTKAEEDPPRAKRCR